jgi:predicted DNA-binding protein with PD1-like motif
VRSRRIEAHGGEETFVLVFDAGDEAMEGLTGFARERNVTAAQLSGIGAFSEVTLGYFDWQAKDYRPIPIEEQVEVVSLLGDVASNDGEPVVHAHVVVAGPDGIAHGGHLLAGRVRPTLEVVLVTSPATLRKRHDPESGLALIDLSDGER